MLSNEILEALKGYTEKMDQPVTLVLQTGDHNKRAELVDFLTRFASVSDKLVFEERDTRGALRSPLSFALEVGGDATGIVFSGIPGGHEFNSLVLAVLQSAGTALRLIPDSLGQLLDVIVYLLGLFGGRGLVLLQQALHSIARLLHGLLLL